MHPLVDGNLPNNDYDVGQGERMFEQAKMYTDRGNGCFTNKEYSQIVYSASSVTFELL
jgi:hypothetical protein